MKTSKVQKFLMALLVALMLIVIGMPAMATITVSNPQTFYDKEGNELVCRIHVLWNAEDTDGTVTGVPVYWTTAYGSPKAINWVTWTTAAPWQNDEEVWFLPSEWAAGTYDIYRQGDATATSVAECDLEFVWQLL